MTPEEHRAKYFGPEWALSHDINNIRHWNQHMGRPNGFCAGCKYSRLLHAPCLTCPDTGAYIPAAEIDAFNIWKASRHDT